MAPGQAGLPRGVPCPGAQPVSGCTGLRVPMQRARWALWETPPGPVLEATKQGVGRSHWEPPQEKSSWPGTEGWQPRPSQTLLHPCSSCTHALVLVRLVCCLHTLIPLQSALLPPSPPTEHPAPGTVSHPDTSCPGIPAPHPPSVLARQPLHRAVAMLLVLIRQRWVPALREIPGASPGLDGHSEGCRGPPVTY